MDLKKQSVKLRGCPGKGLGAGSCCVVLPEEEQASKHNFLLMNCTDFEIGSFSAVMLHWDEKTNHTF